MLTEKDYCDHKVCVALEEVGMLLKTQIVRSYAKEGIQTSKIYPNPPSLYEAQKWLREEKKIHIEVYACAGGYMWELCKAYETDTFSGGTTIYTPNDVDNPKLNDAGRYDSYEEVLLEGIKEAVKSLKEEK